MNYTKIKGLFIAAFALFALNISAQTTEAPASKQEHRKHRMQNMTPEQKAEKMTERMTEKLELNEKQKTEVYAVLLKTVEERKENRRRSDEKNRNAVNGEMKNILTPEQFELMLEMQEQRQQKRAERKSKRG